MKASGVKSMAALATAAGGWRQRHGAAAAAIAKGEMAERKSKKASKEGEAEMAKKEICAAAWRNAGGQRQ
jgi:hypothetical protein